MPFQLVKLSAVGAPHLSSDIKAAGGQALAQPTGKE
jgi:hypothetical protein